MLFSKTLSLLLFNIYEVVAFFQMPKAFYKVGCWYLQFWLGYLIVIVETSKLDPVNSNTHFRRFNRHILNYFPEIG